jgi:Bacterial regulatory proteins, tetR family.
MYMRKPSGRNDSDWVRAAGRRLASGGIAAVAVEPLARDLRVTKGSFYWHFRDRAALLTALLADWEAGSTEPLLRRLQAGQGPRARLDRLAATVAGEGAGALDPAIRAWARHDVAAAETVGRVDRARLAVIAGEFRSLGFAPAEAWTRARLFYLHLLGEHALAFEERALPERLAEAARVLALLTGGEGI